MRAKPIASVFVGDRGRRFWSHVATSGDPDACWPWVGAREAQGYGKVTARMDGKLTSFKTHRVAYTLVNGPIPDGMCVCHACDNPPCCNPAHLWLGTHQDNMRDRARKGRGREADQWGESSPSAHFTTAEVEAVLALVRSGMSQQKAGERYGMSQPHVSRLVRGVCRQRG